MKMRLATRKMTKIENAGRFDVIIKIRRKKWNIVTHENSALRAAVAKGCIEIKLILLLYLLKYEICFSMLAQVPFLMRDLPEDFKLSRFLPIIKSLFPSQTRSEKPDF